LKATGAPVLVSERFVDGSGPAAWSPDGQYLAYYGLRGFPSGEGSSLVIRSVATGAERDVPLRLVLGGVEGFSPPRWFPDGRSVLISALDQRTQPPRTGYYQVDVSSGNTELLHSSRATGNLARTPDLSPDGKIIYYGEAGDILRFDRESRQATELIGQVARRGGKYVQSYAISPDGAQLAYVLSENTGSGSLEVMPAAGGQAREVARLTPWNGTALVFNLGWAPDGRHLLFSRSTESGTELFQVPLAGGQPQKVGISVGGRIQHPQVHPDGRRIVFWSREQGPNEVWALENFLPTAAVLH
jgi:Tol biopolymer transport system component